LNEAPIAPAPLAIDPAVEARPPPADMPAVGAPAVPDSLQPKGKPAAAKTNVANPSTHDPKRHLMT
jgi:hypothetical protein